MWETITIEKKILNKDFKMKIRIKTLKYNIRIILVIIVIHELIRNITRSGFNWIRHWDFYFDETFPAMIRQLMVVSFNI